MAKIFHYDNNFDRNYERLLNITLPNKFDWFKKINIKSVSTFKMVYGGQLHVRGDIYIDSNWAYKQWREYNYSRPFPSEEEFSFGEIIGGEIALRIKKQFAKVFMALSTDSIEDSEYVSLTGLNVKMVEDNIQESIKKPIVEEKEFSSDFRRRVETFKSIVWNNMVTSYPCDYDDFFQFMRAIESEIRDAIYEAEDDDGYVSEWLTMEEGVRYIEKYMIEDLKEFYVSRCLE